MNDEFISKAKIVLKQMESNFSRKELENDYIYTSLPTLIDEVETSNFSKPKTNIGISALKLEDMGVYKDKKLVEYILQLSELYRLLQKKSNP